MALFTKESLETLRQRVDLVDVLTSHIDLKRTGAAYKALCPFHDEKTPSFTIQKGDTHYHCFGCGAHGDAIQFLTTHLKMTFGDAVESLAQRFNVHLERMESSLEPKGPSKGLLKEALDHASRFYHFMLLHTPEGQVALQYLFQRGLDLDFIKHFQIGFAPSGNILRKVLHGKFVKDEIMLEAGLLASAKSGNGYRDFFADRITFPIRDASGAVIGFSARKYKEETFGGKYINTPETPLFKKSRVLFGLNYSRKRIAKERKAIIVEGQIDALRLIQAGFNITVAGQGTAFGEGHAAELLTLGVNQVFLALDGDNAGQQAAYKIGNLFQKAGVEVHIVPLPLKSDPDTFLRQFGPEAFYALLKKGIDYITFLVNYLSKNVNVDTPAGKNELIQTIVQQVRSWDHSLMVHESLRRLAHLTHTPEDIVGVGQEFIPNIHIKRTASIGLQMIEPDRIAEADLLRWLLIMGESKPSFVEMARSHLEAEDFRVGICRHVYITYLECHDRNHSKDILSITARMEDAEGQTLIAELLQKKVNREKAEEEFMKTIQTILTRNWMEKCEAIRRRIQSGECSDDEVGPLTLQYTELRAKQPKISI